MEKSNEKESTEYEIGLGMLSVKKKKTVEKPKFPYGCKFCSRENVCSKYGNSCGRPDCNDALKEEEKSMFPGEKYLRRLF